MYNILIVDDEPTALAALQMHMDDARLGISHIATALNIEEAKRALLEGGQDMLLCDIEMPMGSGIQLVEWIRSHGMDTVCMFLTAHTDLQYLKNAISLGVFEYMLKPIHHEELISLILRAQQRCKEIEGQRRAAQGMRAATDRVLEGQDPQQSSRLAVEEVCSYIDKRIAGELTRNELADVVFLSPDHLTRIFKKETGWRLSDYVRRRRVHFACEMLAKTSLSISQIATSVGFTNMAHFAKTFKDETGLTPTDYRKKFYG